MDGIRCHGADGFQTSPFLVQFLLLLPATFGWVGVAIFFVVSGFCIHLSFTRHPEWAIFFQRRFFRIYPPYLVALIFFALVYPITRLRFESRFDAAQFITHLALIHNLGHRFHYSINGSFWSIAAEVQLYAVYPLLLLLAARFGWRRSLLGLAALEIALRLADGMLLTFRGAGIPQYLSSSPLIYWFSWSLGAFVAEWHIRGIPLRVPRISLYALGVIAFACKFFRPLASMCFLLFALLTAGVISQLLDKEDRHRLIPGAIRNHLKQVGLCSFSLYLLHQPLLRAIPSIAAKITSNDHIHPVLLFMCCMASWFLIVPIALLSYKILEIPSVALGKKLFEKPIGIPRRSDSDASGCSSCHPFQSHAGPTPSEPEF